MSKRKKVIGGLLVVLAVLVVVGVWKWQWVTTNSGDKATWSVVYLSSGEIYVGELSWGRKPQFTNGYLVMKVANEKDPKTSDIRLQPLNETVWAPTSLTLNPAHILFHGPLDLNSTAAQKLRDRSVIK